MMKSTKTKSQVLDDILNESNKCYGKLLSPFKHTFSFTVDDLICYIFTAIDLLDGIKLKLQELMKMKSILNSKYKDKSKNTLKSIESTIFKLKILQSKILKFKAGLDDQNSSNYCYDVASKFLLQKVVEIQNVLTHEDIEDKEDKEKAIEDSSNEDSNSNQNEPNDSDMISSEVSIDSSTTLFNSLLSSELFNSESSTKNNFRVGINPTALCTEVLIKVLLKMEEALSKLINSPNNFDYCEFFYRADFLHVYEGSIHEIIKMPDDDVFYYSDLSDDRASKFNNIVTNVYPEYRESFMVRYRYFSYLIEYGLALFSKTMNKENHLMQAIKFLWYAPIYLFSNKRRQSQFKSFICSDNLDLMMKIAKASGNSLSKFACYFINPRIKFHKKIYIPRNYEKLTIDNLNEFLTQFMNQDQTTQANKIKLKRKLRASNSFSHQIHHKLTVKTQSFSYKNKRDMVLLRIASPFKMSLDSTGSKSITPPIECEAVLIHIHGGGFVSQSSSQHQIYLRRWAKQNNIPVLMTTYRLSPEAEYPQALDDSWQTYCWILDKLKNILKI